MIAVAVGLLAFLLLAITAQDAFEVMLLPRRVLRQLRFVSIFYRVTWAPWAALTSRFTRGERKEHLLGVYGALSMVLLFSVWIAGLMLGFGLLLWAIEAAVGVTPRPTLGDQLYLSGVTFFTLGYGDLVPHSGLARLLTIVEAGTGLGFIAVVIGYLPVLYQLFSRREAAVIRLDGRAGSPPTAVGLLQRHGGEDGPGQIGIMLREWETWGSELLESHLSYPMLAYYRSQHADQSWLAALTVVIDCCALILVGIGRVPPLQARMTFTMARQILVEMAQAFGVAPSRYEGGDRLDHPTFRVLAKGARRCRVRLGNNGSRRAAGGAARHLRAAARRARLLFAAAAARLDAGRRRPRPLGARPARHPGAPSGRRTDADRRCSRAWGRRRQPVAAPAVAAAQQIADRHSRSPRSPQGVQGVIRRLGTGLG